MFSDCLISRLNLRDLASRVQIHDIHLVIDQGTPSWRVLKFLTVFDQRNKNKRGLDKITLKD